MGRFHSSVNKVLVVQTENMQNQNWRATNFIQETKSLCIFPKFQEKLLILRGKVGLPFELIMCIPCMLL